MDETTSIKMYGLSAYGRIAVVNKAMDALVCAYECEPEYCTHMED